MLAPGKIMAFLGFLMVAWTVGFAVSEVALSELDCEGITDSDARHMCRAIARQDKNECELIKREQMRIECRALVVSK